jgi:5'-phosphate synthase pdxT subunit
MEFLSMKTIGVLSLQGGFAKHLEMLSRLSCKTRSVRDVEDLPGLDGLILPGGESTTLGMLLNRRNLASPLQNLVKDGFPFFGTCAGMILLSHEVHGRNPLHLNALDVEIDRNAYGSQIDSFEASIDLSLNDREHSFLGIFIRAPKIRSIGPNVKLLAEFAGTPVLVEQGSVLAASFHPELSDDTTIHEYFLNTHC